MNAHRERITGTEPASRVERVRILLAYREDLSLGEADTAKLRSIAQSRRPPPRCHDFSSRSLVGTRDICGNPKTKMNPRLSQLTSFMELIV